MKELGVESNTRRINFTPATKKILRAAAGSRCCFRTCLRPTEGISLKNIDEKMVKGIGVAAHVYAAREDGPRGQGGLSLDQIKHPSNGMWMCAYHGREVDDFQDRYSAEYLLRMKAVRELAHDLELHNDYIAFFVNKVSLMDWNDCVWDQVAEISVDAIHKVYRPPIVNSFISLAIQKMALFDKYKHTLPSKLPSKFAVKPIASAMSAFSPQPQDLGDFPLLAVRQKPALDTRPYDRERKRAVDIAKAWRKDHDPDFNIGTYFLHNCEVLLTARDPTTGIIFDGGIWQSADIHSRLSYSLEEGEIVLIRVTHTFDDASVFDWKLSVEIKHGTHRIESELRQRPLRMPYLRDQFRCSEFYMYRDLLEKIASGWELLGSVSLLTDDSGFKSLSELYPVPFDIERKLSAMDLDRMVHDCEKVAAGLEVARRWAAYYGSEYSDSTDFTFNDVFFMDLVDPDLIYRAYDELIAVCDRNKLNPNKWTTAPLLMNNGRFGVCFRYRRGALMFERAAIHHNRNA